MKLRLLLSYKFVNYYWEGLRAPARLVLILACLQLHLQSNAQLIVTDGQQEPYTPLNLISNVFLGNGVEIINIQYEGMDHSVGYFENAKNQIDLDRGIIMTTGRADFADLPNDKTNTSSHSSAKTMLDADLLTAIDLDPGIPNLLQDISRYTITFIPYDDSLSFKYVFASEEYPEYACSKYEDVFGFFVTGPNPGGGNYQARNIALVPGTGESVSISNVNGGDEDTPFCYAKNGQYYNDNSGSDHLTYNAYLDIFTAGVKVIPCEEYTIKIAIADVADALYDSAVFLEAKSFSTNGIEVQLNTPGTDDKISEGCVPAYVNFSFEKARETDFEIDYKIISAFNDLSMATKGLDFDGLPDKLIVPAGKKDLTISIQALQDEIQEEDEYLLIDYQKNACVRDTIYLAITDPIVPDLIVPDTVEICSGDSLLINVTFTDDFEFPEPKTYQNQNDFIISPMNTPVYSDILISGVNASSLGPGVISKVCIDTAWNSNLEDFDFFLYTPGGQYIELSTDNGKRDFGGASIDSLINTCFTEKATEKIHFGNSGLGIMDPSNPSYTGEYAPEGIWSDLWPDEHQPVNGIWRLMVMDDDQSFVGRLESWSITLNSQYSIDFEWQPDNENISCLDCEDPLVYPTSNTTYTVFTTDSYGCIKTESVHVPVSYIPAPESLHCDSISTDLIRFSWSAVQNYSNYEYRINQSGDWVQTDQTSIEVSGLSNDEEIFIELRTYDQNCKGQIITASCTTFPCPAPAIELIDIFHPQCYGDLTGRIQIEATGQFEPYVYELNGLVNTTGYFESLEAGEHILYITDSESCRIPYKFEIQQAPAIKIEIDITNISCHDYNDGELNAKLSGGTGNLESYWLDDSGLLYYEDTLKSLASGTYSIFTTDDKGCKADSIISLINPSEISTEIQLHPVICFGESTGSIHVDVQGGHGNYIYNWIYPNGETNMNEDLYGVGSGVYQLEIGDDGGCTLDTLILLSGPESPLSAIIEGRDTLCHGYSDGYIELQLTGGTGDHLIEWSNGSADFMLENLAAGLYGFIARDEAGCELIDRVEIIELKPLTIQTDQIGPSCFNSKDGRIEVSDIFYGDQSAGLESFDFNWLTTPAQNSPVATYLSGSTNYTLLLEDAYECKYQKTVYLEGPDSLKTAWIHQKDASCFGSSDGSITVKAQGGTSPYQYNWGPEVEIFSDSMALELSAGWYNLSITDSHNCTAEFKYKIQNPEPISSNSTIKHVQCHDGSDGQIELSVAGGTPPYNFSWSDGQFGNPATNLASGNISVTIRDLNMCETRDSFVIIQPESGIEIYAESVDPICFGDHDGQIILEGSGGTKPYAFRIGSRPFQGNNTFIGIKAGNYTGMIEDANNCIAELGSIVVNDGNKLNVSLGLDTVLTYGERIELIPSIESDNSWDYSYLWHSTEPGVLSCLDCDRTIVSTEIPVYISLKVTDENDCVGEDNVYIGIQLDKFINIPTAFTPNNDGLNDILQVFGSPGAFVKRFEIFDRSGTTLYKSGGFYVNDVSTGWDGRYMGKLMEADNYSWYLEVEHLNNTSTIYKGQSTLIR